MDVLAAAASIGLSSGAGEDLFGTIEEEAVLSTLWALAEEHPGNGDLFAEAVARVQLARSAGVRHLPRESVFAIGRSELDVQLRYRAEMLEMFIDLAIDLAGRALDEAAKITQ